MWIALIIVAGLAVVALLLHLWDKAYGKEYTDAYGKSLSNVANYTFLNKEEQAVDVQELIEEGWCDDCEHDLALCLLQGKCQYCQEAKDMFEEE